MSHKRTDSDNSILNILSIDSAEYFTVFDSSYNTDLLVDDAKKLIKKYEGDLRQAHKEIRLDEMLLSMLDYAPVPFGKRYVTIVIIMVCQKKPPEIVNAANTWLDHLFFPMMTSHKARKTEPNSSQTPTFQVTSTNITTSDRQPNFRHIIAQREQYTCAITKAFDQTRMNYLVREGRSTEIPDIAQVAMEAAHIIPFSLNKFDDKSEGLFSAATTWDMLASWTGIEVNELLGELINRPENGIYMNASDHTKFGNFAFYLDEDPENPNKYKLKMHQPLLRLSNGGKTADVEFGAGPNIPPPNPKYLKAHAAIGKVLQSSKIGMFVEHVKADASQGASAEANKTEEFSALLRSKLLTASSRPS